MILRKITTVVATLSLLASGACTPRKQQDAAEIPQVSPAEAEAFSAPETPLVLAPENREQEGEQEPPSPEKGEGFVLACPGGGVRSFSIQGVVEIFEESKIPIHAVVGWGSGALFAAAYAVSSSVHEFEWRLQKLNDAVFATGEGGSGIARWLGAGGAGKAREASIRKMLGDLEFAHARRPVHILSKGAGRISGKLADAVIESVENPPEVVDLSVYTNEHGSPLIVVETGDPALRGESGAIRLVPALSGIGEGDFPKRGISAYKGKLAAKEALQRIRERLR